MLGGNSKRGFLVYFLPFFIELTYFGSCLISIPPLVRTIIAFPSLFIIPGLMFLIALSAPNQKGVIRMIVEGFFISTLIAVVLTSLMFMLSIPLTPFFYSLVIIILVFVLSKVMFIRKIKLKEKKHEKSLILIALSVFVLLLLIFSGLPRFFRPDETKYIFSARSGILDGLISPTMEISPTMNDITATIQGRYFWIYLLASFLASTGLPAFQAGLLGVGFLILTALTATLLVEKAWNRFALFFIVVINPLLILHSGSAFNDLVIAFYSTFAIVFFVESFSKYNKNVSINTNNLFYSFLGIIPLILIKTNILLPICMLLILVYIIIRYRLHEKNSKYKALLLIILLPILTYELLLELPYIVITRFFNPSEFGNLYYFLRDIRMDIRPLEMFIRWFTPSWQDASLRAGPVLIYHDFIDYLDHAYRLFMPEYFTLVVSAVILISPLLLFWKEIRQDLTFNILVSLVVLGTCIFYLNSFVWNLYGMSKYLPFMVPINLVVTIKVLYKSFENRDFLPFSFINLSMIFILYINLYLTRRLGGVYVGFPGSRLYTVDVIVEQLIFFTVAISLFIISKNKKLKVSVNFLSDSVKKFDLNKVIFCLLMVGLILNTLYFSTRLMEESSLYQDHNFDKMNEILNESVDGKHLIFVNNYIFLRPFLSDTLLKNNSILSSPESANEFHKILEAAPNGTLFLISNDDLTSWFEYGNKYLTLYVNSDIITLNNYNNTYAYKIQSFPVGNDNTVSFFKIVRNNHNLSPKNVNGLQNEIFVKVARMDFDEEHNITLQLTVESTIKRNVTLLVSTDRFTKVYTLKLDIGYNHIGFEYPCLVGEIREGPYWMYFTSTRIILLSENKIRYKTDISSFNFHNINFLLGLVSLIVSSAFLIMKFSKEHGKPSKHRTLRTLYTLCVHLLFGCLVGLKSVITYQGSGPTWRS